MMYGDPLVSFEITTFNLNMSLKNNLKFSLTLKCLVVTKVFMCDLFEALKRYIRTWI